MHSPTVYNACDKCVANSYKYDLNAYCQQFQVILYCQVYYDQKNCEKCTDGYQLLTPQTCVKIPDFKNCLQFSFGRCVQCKSNYFLDSGQCFLPSDYQLAGCEQNNIDGFISSGQFQCSYCQKDTIPLNLKSYYVCTLLEPLEFKTDNCIKYGQNARGKYVCDRCQAGYFMFFGICVSQCPAGSVLYLSKITGYNTNSQTKQNNFTISSVNSCDFPPNGISNCEIVTPGIVRDKVNSDLTLVNSYVCHKCLAGMIKVVPSSLYSAGSGVGVRNRNFQNDDLTDSIIPIEMYQAFECVDPTNLYFFTSDIVLSKNSLITNCEIYYIPDPAFSTQYCCFKCMFGYSGPVLAIKNRDSDLGCLSSCVLIKNCNTAVYYHGLSRNIPEITFARGLLETYVTCHKCTDGVPITVLSFVSGTNFNQNKPSATSGISAGLTKGFPKPILFSIPSARQLAAEKENIITSCDCFAYSSTQYPVFYGKSYQTCSYKTIQIFNFNSNTYSTISCGSISNSVFILSPHKIKNAMNEGAGSSSNVKSTQTMTFCDTMSTSLFSPLYQNENRSGGIVGNAIPLATNCAIYLINADQVPIVNNQNTASISLIDNLSIYCAACLPGYKPVDFYTNHLPYLVYNCVPINNCNSSPATWANFCEKCLTGYIWTYNTLKLEVNFAICVPKEVPDPNCLAVIETNQKICGLCFKGYYLNADKYCDRIQIPNCNDSSFVFLNIVIFNPDYPFYFGPLISYLTPETQSCNQCMPSMVALRTAVDTFICVKSDYIVSRNFLPDSVFKSIKCVYFYMDSSGNYMCYQCENNYIVAVSGSCFELNPINHQNCLIALTSTLCETCFGGYVFVNGFCLKQNIKNCLNYKNDKTLTTQICSTCQNNYYVDGNGSKCSQGAISNCVTYNSPTDCTSCNTGFMVLGLAGSISYCIPVPSELKCILFDYNFQTGKMNCQKCYTGFVSSSTGDFPNNYCLLFKKVENCVVYDVQKTLVNSSFNCTQCKNDYFINTKFECQIRTKVDPNCSMFLTDDDKCILCKNGYYLFSDGLTCSLNPTGIKGCTVYVSEKICGVCSNGYYLRNNLCISVDNNTVKNCGVYQGLSI